MAHHYIVKMVQQQWHINTHTAADIAMVTYINLTQ